MIPTRGSWLFGILLAGGAALAALVSGCAPQAPIISHQLAPWEEEYARATAQPEPLLPDPGPPTSAHMRRRQLGEGSDHDPSREAAELMSLPFRGVGWLLRAAF